MSCNSEKDKVIRIAVASNLAEPVNIITTHYLEQTNEKIEIIIGSSGKLMTQIAHGAPYDIFISADTKYLNALDKKDLLIAAPTDFIQGSLVLWTSFNNIDFHFDLLTSEKIKKIAIPNPEIAPYGKAAKEALVNLKIWDEIQDKLVFGESVTQTNQFIMTKAVQAGITSRSFMYSTRNKIGGQWLYINNNLHHAIRHGLAILKTSKKVESCNKFIRYLNDHESETILTQYGYQP